MSHGSTLAHILILLALAGALAGGGAIWTQTAMAETTTANLMFDFGAGEAIDGCIKVRPDTTYTPERGFGLSSANPIRAIGRLSGDPLHGDLLTSDEPFYFSVDLSEGNYHVAVTLAGGEAGSTTTVKAEARRLMLEQVAVPAGETVTRIFAVNVRTPRLPDGREVKLRRSEDRASATWDEKLTLEFSGERPAVSAVEIVPADDVIIVFIAGDSTVVDGAREPWSGWGQMLPRFFGPGVAVSNHAESGRTLRSFRGDRRLDKVLSMMQPGDYLFIQFGHNDMKETGAGIGPFTSYADDLKAYIAAARERGATPVLVTPMHRRRFDGSNIRNTHGDYPGAVRQVAAEQGVALIDLHALSKTFFEALGRDDSARAFVHYPANTFPGQDEPLRDNSHFSPYGAYQLARQIVEGIRENELPLAEQLRDDFEPFNPADPPPPQHWNVPASSSFSIVAPEGS